MDRYQMKDSDWEILLPGGIQWGVSNADDIKAAYGDPTSDYDGDNYYKMSYQYDFYREIETTGYYTASIPSRSYRMLLPYPTSLPRL